MAHFVSNVTLTTVIAKIAEMVIGPVAIVMTALKAIWSLANKCQKHQPVHRQILDAIVRVKNNAMVAF